MAQRGGGVVRDAAMAYKRAALFLPASVGGGAWTTTDTLAIALAAGAPILTAIQADSEMHALAMAAANDEMYWGVCPKTEMWMFNFDYNLHAQVLYTHTAAAADENIDWKVDVKGVVEGDALSDAGSSPDGTVQLAADTVEATADSLEVTSEGALVTADKDFDLDDFLMFKVTCTDLGEASANEILLIGLRIFGTMSMASSTDRAQTT